MVDSKSLKTLDLFASMEQRELDRLAQRAADIALKPSEWLVREDERMHFFVVLEGTLQLAKQINGREIHLADLKMGDFFGEIPLLLGLPSASSLQAKTACRVARFESEQLQELIQTSSACSEKILQVVKKRLSSFQDYAMDLPPPRVLVVGSQHDANCQAVRSFLTLNRISHEWITRETERIRVPASLPVESNPVAALIDGAQWVTPPVTVRTVARALGYRTQASSDNYDVVITGGGPAGLAAAIYGASEGLDVLLIERNAAGGQAGNSTRIENYLGFRNGGLRG